MESQLVDGNDDMGVSGDVGLSTYEVDTSSPKSLIC